MKLSLSSQKKLILAGLFILCIAGCASVPVVPPTFEEAQAAKSFKKNVAIVECRDNASPIRGLEAIALPGIESLFIGRTNLVERQALGKIFNEWELQQSGAAEKAQELGKLLGAQYIVASSVTASLSEPDMRHNFSRNKKGKFYGSIRDEITAHAQVTLRIIDASTGVIVYSGRKDAEISRAYNEESFDDETRFNQALKLRRTVNAVKQIRQGYMSSLEKQNSDIVSSAISCAIQQFNQDAVRAFAQAGEILQIASKKQVLINLGSAYGIRPGDTFIVWEEQAPIKDPKTGNMIVPREKQAILKVVKVTSGLSAIAQGSEKDVSRLRVADKVYSY